MGPAGPARPQGRVPPGVSPGGLAAERLTSRQFFRSPGARIFPRLKSESRQFFRFSEPCIQHSRRSIATPPPDGSSALREIVYCHDAAGDLYFPFTFYARLPRSFPFPRSRYTATAHFPSISPLTRGFAQLLSYLRSFSAAFCAAFLHFIAAILRFLCGFLSSFCRISSIHLSISLVSSTSYPQSTPSAWSVSTPLGASARKNPVQHLYISAALSAQGWGS